MIDKLQASSVQYKMGLTRSTSGRAIGGLILIFIDFNIPELTPRCH